MINLRELDEKRKEKAKSPKKCKGIVKFCCIGCVSFGFFQIGHLPSTKITFFDTCQKTVSTQAPQFRSNLFCSEINSSHDCQRLNESPFSKQIEYQIHILPLGTSYKYLYLPLRWHISYSTFTFSLAREHICSTAATAAL